MATAESFQTDWQTSKNSLKERNKHMFNNTLISDVNFSVKDPNTDHDQQQSLVIPAHKYILAISSPVFFAMFYGQMPNTSHTIELPDSDSDSFLEFLRFLYCDEVKLTGSNVFHVLYLAKKYIIPSLSRECTKFLEENLDARNVFSIIPGAQIHEEVSLVETCWEMVDESSQEAMNSEAFLDVSQELLKAVLKRDSLDSSEVDIFKAVDRWAAHQCRKKTQREVNGKEKRRMLGDAINLIRFPLMTENEFASIVPKTTILSKEIMCDIFLYFNNENGSPLKFSGVARRGTNKSQIIKRVMRFHCVKHSWVYGGGSNAVAFSVNCNVSVRGVRLFGTRGSTYSVTIGIYHNESGVKMTEESGRFDTDKEITSVGYYGFDVLFKKPAAVKENENYEIRAEIAGPSASYSGCTHQTEVTCCKVVFSFSNAKSTNNTTAVGGQFPEILFT